MNRVALLALSLALAGCQQATMQAGDLRATQTSFLTKNTLTATCAEFNADGTPASSATLDTSSVGDAAMAREIIGGIGAIVGQLNPVPKPPGAGVRQGRQGMTASDGANAAACLLEHFKGEQAPFPPQPPPQVQPQPPPVPQAGEHPAPEARRPALFDPGPHEGRDGRVRVLRAVFDGVPGAPASVWYTLGGKAKTLPVADWTALNGGGE